MLNSYKLLLEVVGRSLPDHISVKLHENPLPVLLKLTQKSDYPELYQHLLGTPVALPDDTRSLMGVRSFAIDPPGLIRTEALRAPICEAVDYVPPVLLSRKSHLWHLIVLHHHEEHGHGNTSVLLVSLQKQFWVSRMRQSVRSILFSCIDCKRFRNAPFQTPELAKLHLNRIQYTYPFEVTGVDFTGSYHLKGPIAKAYICLFTCTATRAVALETVATDGITDFLMAVRRLASCFGMPRQFYSDNAATFRSGSGFINALIDSTPLRSYVTSHGAAWSYITPLAPWQGGVYERMIGVVKRSLHKVLSRFHFSYEEFRTLLQETECVVNNRPLSYVSTADNSYALTPYHLIFGRSLDQFPQSRIYDFKDPDFGPVKKYYVSYQRLANALERFSIRFRTEYVSSLYNRSLVHPRRRVSPPEIGEIVLLVISGLKRYQYPLGRVTQIYPDHEGIVRSVLVKTEKGEYKRPVSKIIPLEIRPSDLCCDEKTSPESSAPAVQASKAYPKFHPRIHPSLA